MSDYKSVKEAFVAGNPGTSIWTVNVVSLIGLSSYALYASISRIPGYRPTPILDYTSMVLPLLLGQTILSSQPLLFNIFLLALSLAIRSTWLSNHPPTRLGSPSSPKTPAQAKELDTSSDEDQPPVPKLRVSRSSRSPRISHDPQGATITMRKPLPDLPVTSKSPFSTSTTTTSTRSSPLVPGTPSRCPSPSHTIDIAGTPPSSPSHPRTFAAKQDIAPGLAGGQIRLPPQPFLSVYRAHMMIMTVIAILAVDFEVFPRGFGKCEDWGTGLMDIGVGSFVFSQGIISALPLLRNPSSASLPLLPRLASSIRKTLPVLALGGIRVLMVKGVEYPEHVTEYGVHWNFFFTLGLMPFFGTLLAGVGRKMRCLTIAVIITCCHQVGLTFLGGQDWVMFGPRRGLVEQNKEGLVSFPGYLTIFLLGLDIGFYLLPPDPHMWKHLSTPAREKGQIGKRKPYKLAMILGSYSIIWWTLLFGIRLGGVQVSRRLANLAYVVWIVAFNTTFLLGYLAVELFFFPVDRQQGSVPPLLASYNKNGLVVFLVANLMTGLVNVSVKTMYAGTGAAMGILVLYTGGVSAISWILRGFTMKL